MKDSLESYLIEKLPHLEGEWVKKNSYYESFISQILEMTDDKCRYWDARWQDYFIEFKKGTSVWLDLVRYSEILTKLNENAIQKVHSLFFIPNKDREKIVEIICVETEEIMKRLELDSAKALSILELHKVVPRSLNAQASLTLKDLRQIAMFVIK